MVAEDVDPLRTRYHAAFAAMLAYQDRFPPAHRTIEQIHYLSKLTDICSSAKYKFDMANLGEWKREQVG